MLGDAAHPMPPMLGQALDSVIGDVAVFAKALKLHEDVDQALTTFNKKRRPEVKAMLHVDELVTGLHLPFFNASQVPNSTHVYTACSTFPTANILAKAHQC